MGVDVDEAGQHGQPAQIVDPCARRRGRPPGLLRDFDDPRSLDHDARVAEGPPSPVEEDAGAEHDGLRRAHDGQRAEDGEQQRTRESRDGLASTWAAAASACRRP